MNRYETVFIIDPDVAGPDQEAIIDRIRSLISQHDGRLLVFDDWGIRKFAYEIQKKKQGHYIRIEYAGNGELVYSIERFFRIDFRVLKFLTIVLDRNIDPDSLPTEEPQTSFTSAVTSEQPSAGTETEKPEAPVAPEEETREEEAQEEEAQEEEASRIAEAPGEAEETQETEETQAAESETKESSDGF
ncbi:MAG: 30S ribosomal protein S6 [Desulfobacterales bacterium]|nr:30S ribosomal protein S6 [Desulfobacterales bacterium]